MRASLGLAERGDDIDEVARLALAPDAHGAAGGRLERDHVLRVVRDRTHGRIGGLARGSPAPPGTAKSAGDPLFANTITGDVRIDQASPARHAADRGSDLTGIASRDIDGDMQSLRSTSEPTRCRRPAGSTQRAIGPDSLTIIARPARQSSPPWRAIAPRRNRAPPAPMQRLRAPRHTAP